MTSKKPNSFEEPEKFSDSEVSKTKPLKSASISELISFSKFSLIGLSLVILSIVVWWLFGLEVEVGTGLIAIFALVLFLGLVVDLLRWREYTEWGALGAIIAYIGLIFIFIPLVFNMLAFLMNITEFTRENLLTVPIFSVFGLSWYEVIMIIGAGIMFFGLTSRATELDQKIVDQFFLFKEWVKAGGIRQSLSALRQLIWTIVSGFFRYIGQGIKELRTRIKKFIRLISQAFIFVLGSSLVFLTQTFPRILKRSLISLWNNFHWIGLIAVIIYLIIAPDLPIPSTDPLVIKAEIIIIILFFFFLGVLYPQRDRVVRITQSARKTVLTGVISAYSMLSGTKIKAEEALFCSRCLRGVEIREFESLMEIKETVNPPCPFCGFDNWTGIGTQDIRWVTEKPLEEKILTSVTLDVKPEAVKPSETLPSNLDEKAMKKGRFPDFQSYKRAQELGARNQSELEYIDRLGSPDRETANKIRKGGFAHYRTYQKAMSVGTSNVSELRLIEELGTPDLETAIKVQNSSFPDYQSYKRAQDLGAPTYSELEFIDRLGAPDYETATKMNRGNFPDYSSYQRAQDLGALNYFQLKEIDRYQASDYETAEKIRKGGFPDFQTYQKAQEVGISSFYQYQRVEELQAPDYETAKKMDRGEFPDYSSYKRAQDLGASTYSELEEINHYQAPDFETVKQIKQGGFPDFPTYQKAQEIGASSFSEYQSIESPEDVESETINGVPQTQEPRELDKEKLSTLLDELLKVSQRVADSNRRMLEWHRLLLGRVTRFQKAKIGLDTFEKMISHSEKSLLKINLDGMQSEDIRDYEDINTLLYAIFQKLKTMDKTAQPAPVTPQPTVVQVEKKYQICKICGEKQEEYFSYCISCGTKLKDDTFESASNEKIQGQLCPSCGANIYHKSSRTCPYCSVRLK
ncbi:MAG: hypothetical protein JSV04_04075 [Candidatus Heimdallarchaeota archaeon]|nr:MAG: hypothetical protein JSV04_04075 [Candidatus Heimdallarchaeota archaeon]